MDGLAVSDADRRERFERVFGLAYEPIQRYVRRRGAGSETDDIVAEALTVVWRRLGDVPEGLEIPWCLGVARRCLANQRRSVKRRNNLVRRIASQPDLPAPGDGDPDLSAALARLDEDRREILRLWAWEGFGPGEIATVLGISANAASIRLHRARRDLADALGDLGVAGSINGSNKPDGKNHGDAGHSSVGADDQEEGQ